MKVLFWVDTLRRGRNVCFLAGRLTLSFVNNISNSVVNHPDLYLLKLLHNMFKGDDCKISYRVFSVEMSKSRG